MRLRRARRQDWGTRKPRSSRSWVKRTLRARRSGFRVYRKRK